MKKFLLFCLTFSSLLCISQSDPDSYRDKKPVLYLDKYKTLLPEGKYINCLAINDLGCVMYLNDQFQNYDQVKLELHRFGDAADIVAATKTFEPASKEYQKKYAKLDSLKISILAEEGQFTGSELVTNTTVFPANSTTNMAFCKSHDIKNCSWYVILRGYKKTGEKTQFNEDIYDKGTDLSQKSVMFKSWH